MKNPALLAALVALISMPAFADPVSDLANDNLQIQKFRKANGDRAAWTPQQEQRYQDLLAKRRTDRLRAAPEVVDEHLRDANGVIRRDAHEAGATIKRDAQIVGSDIERAWDKIEKATVKSMENVAGAIHAIASQAEQDLAQLGHHVHNGFAKMQRHLDVVRNGHSISIAYCDSKLFNGPQKVLGVGKGENCQVLQNGTMRMNDVKSCMNADRDMIGAQPLARQLQGMDTSTKYGHEYFLTYEAEPSDIKALLGRCQDRLAAAARKAAARKAASAPAQSLPSTVQVPAPAPIDHSGDPLPVVTAPSGQL
jgi:hypothetical protein